MPNKNLKNPEITGTGTGTGLCDICGNIGRLQTCMLCGRRVCQNCYILEKGACKLCIGGMRYNNPQKD